MTVPRMDLAALFEAIDTERVRRGLTWSALSREVGVSSSTIRRFGHADDAEADGVLAVLRWLKVVPEDYVPGGATSGTHLPTTDGQQHVRVDMALVAKANGERNGAAGRTRTTIQRLVAVADRAGQPIASLTKLTEG